MLGLTSNSTIINATINGFRYLLMRDNSIIHELTYHGRVVPQIDNTSNVEHISLVRHHSLVRLNANFPSLSLSIDNDAVIDKFIINRDDITESDQVSIVAHQYGNRNNDQPVEIEHKSYLPGNDYFRAREIAKLPLPNTLDIMKMVGLYTLSNEDKLQMSRSNKNSSGVMPRTRKKSRNKRTPKRRSY
jgi:hypothetical protein